MTLVVSFQLRTYCDEQYVLRPSSAGQCGWFSVVQSQSSFAGSDSNGKGTAGVCLGAAFPHRLVSYSSCILSFLKISCEPASSHGLSLSKTSTWLRVSVTLCSPPPVCSYD